MTTYHSVYKVPAGKLLKIAVDLNADQRIDRVRITGDFFVYPEEGITLLEQVLRGSIVERTEIHKQLHQVVHQQDMQLFGVHAAAIADAIVMAVSQGDK